MHALSDGPQSLKPHKFKMVMEDLQQVAQIMGKETVIETRAVASAVAALLVFSAIAVDWICAKSANLWQEDFSKWKDYIIIKSKVL